MAGVPIVTHDFCGTSNQQITKTYARLLQGGSWKKQRVIVVMPSADMIPAKVALTHWNLMFPLNNNSARILVLGCEVGEAYSRAIQDILDHPEWSTWEYMLTIEHDNMPPPMGVLQLLKRMEQYPHLSAIGGLYFKYDAAGGPYPQIWGDKQDPGFSAIPQLPDVKGGVVECQMVGMGFTLWRLPMFKDSRLRKPWFATTPTRSQDLYFWEDARQHGYRCGVDCGTRVGHYSMKDDVIY